MMGGQVYVVDQVESVPLQLQLPTSVWGYAHRNMLVFARSMISSPRPLSTALIM